MDREPKFASIFTLFLSHNKMNAATLLDAVNNQHASTNTKMHCLYAHFILGIKRSRLATLFGKYPTTISNWIDCFKEHGNVDRRRPAARLKFSPEKREWLVSLYEKEPILYLNEAKIQFQQHFMQTISTASICIILKSYGMTWKTIERRAIQISSAEIVRFTEELLSFPWMLE